jgi:transcriptional regulator with XRE-family HTH domain
MIVPGEALQDQEYRAGLSDAIISIGLPLQIRAMRHHRGWTQRQLADRVGVKQSVISRLETRGTGAFAVATLQRLALAFDVALIVRFAPFSDLVQYEANLTPDTLAVPAFGEEDGKSSSDLPDNGQTSEHDDRYGYA